MHRGLLQITAVLGALSVGLGAFGAHALRRIASDAAVSVFETGVRYQFYHVFALALAAVLYRDYSNKWLEWSGNFFIAGIVLFCGSLYFLTYVKTASKANLEWVGVITPFGGLA